MKIKFMLVALITFLTVPVLWAKPNIVVIMTDNQGYGDVGIYGGLRAPTPRIDQLANEGVMFRDFQVEPNCTPSRAAFLTGRMPIRSGTDGLVMPGQPGGLDPMEVTLAEVLKGAGYATAYYGKWHLGESAEREPQMQGFDHWYGIHNTSLPVDPDFPGTDMNLIEPQKVVEGRVGKPANVERDMDISYRPLIDRDLTEKSVQYIIEGANNEAPFFLMTSFINPHHPVVPHPDFKGMFTTLGNIGGGNLPNDRPIDGVDQTNWLTGKQEHSARDSRLIFFNGNFVGIRWRQFKFLTMEYEKKGSLSRPAYTGISLPQLYNLKSDPKEEYNIMGESGASNVGAYMLKMGVDAQASFKEFPNMDYSKMSRDK